MSNKPQTPAVWRPMSEAKKDGTPYLLKFKTGRPYASLNDAWNRPERLKFPDGYIAVMQCWRDTPAGSSYWGFAAPVGHGGWQDADFVGFQELPN